MCQQFKLKYILDLHQNKASKIDDTSLILGVVSSIAVTLFIAVSCGKRIDDTLMTREYLVTNLLLRQSFPRVRNCAGGQGPPR